ncbi:membrin-11-like [Pyrus ussuriensis x Pyrus communis]|uniref:Membrin-11-like n=1 Tax=Pyrus ussuriensis x Pyrus communis TaxID=2448454 RepID=A0A5N5HKX2_9ROSA|nr:membrin-11-like [Pyrus ussuriensis x Pyrus communis]
MQLTWTQDPNSTLFLSLTCVCVGFARFLCFFITKTELGFLGLTKKEGGRYGFRGEDLSTSIKRYISQIQSLLEHIAEEAQSLKDSLDRYDARNQKRATKRERAELLGRANGDSAHVMRIFDKEAQAGDLVRNSARMLEETNATGETILRKYTEQREFLKVVCYVFMIWVFFQFAFWLSKISKFLYKNIRTKLHIEEFMMNFLE